MSLSTSGVFSTLGDTMMNVRDIMSTARGVQYTGGYHEYTGVSIQIQLFSL